MARKKRNQPGMRWLGAALAALAVAAVLQVATAQSGNDNGGGNVGYNNGNTNGNQNANGLANGNGNGNLNGQSGGANSAGYVAGLGSSIGAGNGNGNGNTGVDNGIANGNYNANGANTGNNNGNNNVGLVNGIGNGNFNGAGVSNVGNNNGNGNVGVANGVGNGNFLDSGSNVGNNNGNGNSGSGNGNGNGNGNRGTAGQGSGNANGVPQFPAGFQSNGNGNLNGNGNGVATKANTASGKGDPIMTGFDGRAFEFLGQPRTFYSIISERHHQLSTKLKVGVMWDHNGTYMEGYGFRYRDHSITVELTPEDELAVSVNGEPLVMTKGETELEMVPYVEGGELVMLWQKHREGLGNAVELTTDLLQVIIWLTPAGTQDEGGVEQPAYLNFDVVLMGPPAGSEMQGIVGETYNRMLAGDAINDAESPLYVPDDYKFHGQGPEENYATDGYFGDHAYGVFGKDRKRVLIEGDSDTSMMAFPLHATGRTAIAAPRRRLLAAALPARRSRRMGRL